MNPVLKVLWSFGRVLMLLMIYLLLQVVVTSAFGFVYGIVEAFEAGGNVDSQALGEKVAVYISSKTSVIILIAACISLIIYALIDRKKGLRKAWHIRPIAIKHVILLVLLGLSCGVVMSFVLQLFSQLDGLKPAFEQYGDLTEQIFDKTSLVLLLLSIGVAAPMIEEILFRAMVFHRLRESMKFSVAFVLQSVLFGVYHFNVVQSTYAALLGLLLAWVLVRYSSILAAICVHMGINVFGVLSTTDIISDMLNEFTWFVFAVGLIVLFLTMFKVAKQHKSSECNV